MSTLALQAPSQQTFNAPCILSQEPPCLDPTSPCPCPCPGLCLWLCLCPCLCLCLGGNHEASVDLCLASAGITKRIQFDINSPINRLVLVGCLASGSKYRKHRAAATATATTTATTKNYYHYYYYYYYYYYYSGTGLVGNRAAKICLGGNR